jgi:hypothetical protein
MLFDVIESIEYPVATNQRVGGSNPSGRTIVLFRFSSSVKKFTSKSPEPAAMAGLGNSWLLSN